MEENNQFINDPIPDQVDLFINDPINDAHFNSLPSGYRFVPTDAELVSCYLEGKVLNKEIPKNRFLDLDISLYHPRDLTERITLIREREWYFFTSRKRKYPKGQRPDRSAVDGYWKATGKAEDIRDNNGKVIGSKRTLDFYQGNHQDSKRTEWKMHEYTLDTDIAPPNQISETPVTPLDNCVLCKIYKNTRGGNNDPSTTQSDQRAEPATIVVASQAFPDQQIQPVHQHDQSHLVGQSSGASSSTANRRRRAMPTPTRLNTYVENPTYYPDQQHPFQNQTLGYPPGTVYNNFNNQNFTQYGHNFTQHDMQSVSHVQPGESFASQPLFLPPMETSTSVDQVPLVDPSSFSSQPRFLPPMEASTSVDQVPLVDPSSFSSQPLFLPPMESSTSVDQVPLVDPSSFSSQPLFLLPMETSTSVDQVPLVDPSSFSSQPRFLPPMEASTSVDQVPLVDPSWFSSQPLFLLPMETSTSVDQVPLVYPSSLSSQPRILPPMETSTAVDQVPLVDPSFMQLPEQVRLYEHERSLEAGNKHGDFTKRPKHWYDQQQLFSQKPNSTPNC